MSQRALSLGPWMRRMIVAAAMVGSWSSANAAVYAGVWDPPYGPPFGTAVNGLGWRGTAEFFVPDTCVPAGNALVPNYPVPFFPWIANCGGDAAVTSAQVELYDVADSVNGFPALATLVFDPSSFHVGLLHYVGGELEGLLSNFSNLVNPPENLWAVNVPSTTEFSLIFTLDGPRLAWRDCSYSEGEGEGYYSTSHHYHCSGGINSNLPGFQPEFTITRVPEPGTFALAGLALLMLAPRKRRATWLRRR